MATTFIGDGADALWTTAGNWSAGIPSASNAATLDGVSGNGNKANTCDIEDVLDITLSAGYTGITTQSVRVTTATFLIQGGTWTAPSDRTYVHDYTQSGGTFLANPDWTTLYGDFNKTGGTFDPKSGVLRFANTGSAQTYQNSTADLFNDVLIEKGVWDLSITGSRLQLDGELWILTSNTSTSPQLSNGTIDLINNATLRQDGNLYVGSGSRIRFQGGNHVWTQNNTSTNAQLPDITVDCTSLTFVQGTPGNVFGMSEFTHIAGTLIDADIAHFKDSLPNNHFYMNLFQPLTIGELTINSGNYDHRISDVAGTTGETLTVLGDMTLSGVSSGTSFTLGTIDVRGSYAQTGTNAGPCLGNMIFAGNADNSIDVDGGFSIACRDVTVNKTGGTLTLLDNLVINSGGSFDQNAGDIDVNGFSISSQGDFRFASNVLGLGAGVTIAVDGNFTAANAVMNATTSWLLNITGTSNVAGSTFSYCDSSLGATTYAYGSIDGGNNINIVFVGIKKFWTLSIPGIASFDGNWSTISGGPPDTVAPTADDQCVFNGGGIGACDWDITEVAIIDGGTAYPGTITQSVSLNCLAFSVLEVEWVTNSFDLRCDFLYRDFSAASLGVTHTAGGTIYWGGNVEQSGTASSILLSPVVIDGGLGTETVAKTHLITGDLDKRPDSCTLLSNQTLRTVGNSYFSTLTLNPNTACTALTSGFLRIENGLINTANCTFLGTTENILTLDLRTGSVDGTDFGNCRLRFFSVIIIADTWRTSGDAQFLSTTAATHVYELINNSSFSCGNLTIGNSNPAFGVNLTQSGESNLQVSGNLLIRQDDTSVSNAWNRTGTLPTTVIDGNLTVEADAALGFSGDTSRIVVQGNIDIHSTAIVSIGSNAFEFIGSLAQTVDFGTGAPAAIFESKTGGSINYVSAWILTGKHEIRASTAYTTTYLAGGLYGANETKVITAAGGIATSSIILVQSTATGVTQFTYTNVLVPIENIWRHLTITDMNFQGGDQLVDQNSSVDNGNNNLSPPTPGLLFGDYPIIPLNGSSRIAIAIGIGI